MEYLKGKQFRIVYNKDTKEIVNGVCREAIVRFTSYNKSSRTYYNKATEKGYQSNSTASMNAFINANKLIIPDC